MVKPATCLALFTAVAVASNHFPRHEGHDHETTGVEEPAATDTGVEHDHHEEPSATVSGEGAESTHSHDDGEGEEHDHADASSTETSDSPAETTPAADSGASGAGLTWSLAFGLVAYIGHLI
ncbi:uncharacterized protein DNG_03177 [Cephalotrichum gorgonifer]|uniref:Uncharacterized protein n=1 Tax=Cephalotrichum gorgonifer TaxID=2041049 RepID=A0AAE8MWG5_9PEZI|nr:uncharacterized protein DNG_03177 [Cephalotrichum gorgonifer]